MSKGQKIRLAVYIVAFLCAVAASVWRIVSIEIGSRTAPLFRFKVEGYDPYDPMRGRYLRLNPRRSLRLKPSEDGNEVFDYWNRTDYENVIYAVLKADADGIVEVARLVKTREEALGEPVLKVKFCGCHYDWSSGDNSVTDSSDKDIEVEYGLPFEKYFISESIADEADRLLTGARNSGTAYLAVRVLPDGSFAVQDLLIDGVPIAQAVANRPKDSVAQ